MLPRHPALLDSFRHQSQPHNVAVVKYTAAEQQQQQPEVTPGETARCVMYDDGNDDGIGRKKAAAKLMRTSELYAHRYHGCLVMREVEKNPDDNHSKEHHVDIPQY